MPNQVAQSPVDPVTWKHPGVPLPHDAATALDVLLALPTHRALLGPLLIDAMHKRGVLVSQTVLTTHIVPRLKAWGVTNQRNVGYYVRPELREVIIRAVYVADARQTLNPDPCMMRPQS